MTTSHRRYTHWMLLPPQDPHSPSTSWNESATVPLLLETLRQLAEVPEIGRERFSGTLAQKNMHWKAYRNFLRQGLSNVEASLSVPNRSACLLQYYAALNLAKAEMVDNSYAAVVDKRIGHGLSFSPTRAKSVIGDHLSVVDGVFPLLYERRTGHTWPRGERLTVRQLLAQIPEISSQALELLGVEPRTGRVFQLLASDGTDSWALLAVEASPLLSKKCTTSKLLHQHFRQVGRPDEWRDHFGFSRRVTDGFLFFESLNTVSNAGSSPLNAHGAVGLTWEIRDILGLRTSEIGDAFLAPYLLESRALALPPALARYALLYYASSLVRYKPAMLDPQLHPAQALMFDAIAREVTLPMLIDTLSALLGSGQLFYAADSFRV